MLSNDLLVHNFYIKGQSVTLGTGGGGGGYGGHGASTLDGDGGDN